MIERDWFKCVNAFNHICNRTPNSNSARHDGRTPYELWHDVRIALRAQLDHLRVLGSLCYVVYPPELVPAGAKKAYKGVMLGYADENEIGQKAYIVRRLNDGKIMTATYAQTYTYENKFPYKKERYGDDDNYVEMDGDARDDANEPDSETEFDEDMSENDSAESIYSNNELATDERKTLEAEALDLAQVEIADDAPCARNSPRKRSNVSESEHDGIGHASLAETDSHDTADRNDEDDVMNGVNDMVRELEIKARARPTHRYKLRQRPKGRSKLELKRELKERGPVARRRYV